MLSFSTITFLGTSSAVPTSTRNHSSLALRLDSDVWLFDCGEATQNRIQQSTIKMGRIKKIFITHTHGDHIFGLVPLLAGIMNGARGTVGMEDTRISNTSAQDPVEIYGPLGTRLYVRAALKTTHTNLEGRCRVHELRFRGDPLVTDEQNITPHKCELEGENILQGLDGTWKAFYEDSLLEVHAAPILHSVPCVGYIVCERPIPGKIDKAAYMPHLERNRADLLKLGIRNIEMKLGDLQRGLTIHLPDGTVLKPPEPRPGFKVVILGDTYNPSGTAELAAGADILVHEATNAFLPEFEGIKERATDNVEMVEQRCRSHGHSTPQMAGAFATRIGAKNLILNHFSARYPGDDDINPESARIMQAIANLAKERFDGSVVCARDLMSIDIQRPAMDR